MKSTLVIGLIQAHLSGDEGRFADAVERLAADEENKGNVALGMEIREAYRDGTFMPSEPMAHREDLFQLSAAVPLDRDSGLSLIEFRTPSVDIDDVIVDPRARAVIDQILEEWKSPEKLPNGILPTKSVLLEGPPGCGKTMTAEAIACKLGIPLAVARPDGIISSYLGQTGANIRRVFDSVCGRRCVLFLDEFEALGKDRTDPNDIGEIKRMMTALLQNMDSLEGGVLLIAATNIPGMLDPAVVRRFDRTVTLNLPDREGRHRFIERFSDDHGLDLSGFEEHLVDVTVGFSYAELEGLLTNLIRDSSVRGPLALESGISELEDFDAESVARRMRDSGATLREIEKVTGIPKSTLSYRFSRGQR